MHWFTWVAICILGVSAFGSITFVLWYNRPPRRRKWRDRDPHESGFIG